MSTGETWPYSKANHADLASRPGFSELTAAIRDEDLQKYLAQAALTTGLVMSVTERERARCCRAIMKTHSFVANTDSDETDNLRNNAVR